MIIEQTFTVHAPAGRTAAFFLDIDEMSSCVPGVEGIQEVGEGAYEATLTVRLGPIKAAFKGAITLDASAAPSTLRASGEGRDRATGSMVKVDFLANLDEESAGVTTVHAVADLTIRGKLAQFGTGVMRAAAGEIVREFAACANAKLAAAAPTVETAGPAGVTEASGTGPEPRTTAPQRGVAHLLGRAVLRKVAGTARRAADKIDAQLDGAGPRS